MLLIKFLIIAILALIIGGGLYIVVANALNRRSYKSKYQAVLRTLLGLEFPRNEMVSIYANDEGLIFVGPSREQKIPKEWLRRVEFYTEHDMRGRAARELVQTGPLEEMLETVPRANKKQDLYVLVINYEKTPGDIRVIGLVGDNPMNILNHFTKGVNRLYGLVEMVEIKEIGLEVPPEDD